MLSAGYTYGVFQCESAGIRNVITRLKPQNIEDIIAVISLYRPGPMDSIDMYINNRHNPKASDIRRRNLKIFLMLLTAVWYIKSRLCKYSGNLRDILSDEPTL